MTDETPVLAERRGGVLVLTLNRPQRLNALNDEMRELLRSHLREARTDAEVRAVVLTGAGRGFCSGAEVGGLRAPEPRPGDPPQPARPITRVPRFAWLEDFHHMPVPVIAAVNGVAAGAGLGLALACDIRVMDRGTYLYPAFAHRGLAADNGVAWTLTHLIGPARTLRWLWSADRLQAEDARAMGVVEVVADEGAALEEALRIAEGWARGPSLAMMAVKQQVYNALSATFAQHLLFEELSVARIAGTEDAREGARAFMEKREANFQGR